MANYQEPEEFGNDMFEQLEESKKKLEKMIIENTKLEGRLKTLAGLLQEVLFEIKVVQYGDLTGPELVMIAERFIKDRRGEKDD